MSVCSFHADNLLTREMQCLALLCVELIYRMLVSQDTKIAHQDRVYQRLGERWRVHPPEAAGSRGAHTGDQLPSRKAQAAR